MAKPAAAVFAAPVGDAVGVVIGPAAVADAHALVAGAVGRRHARREATPADFQLVEALRTAAAATAAMSASGHVPARPLADSGPPAAQSLSVASTAMFLGFSSRHVRRMADAGDLPGSTRVGRDWSIPVAAAAALKARLTPT